MQIVKNTTILYEPNFLNSKLKVLNSSVILLNTIFAFLTLNTPRSAH